MGQVVAEDTGFLAYAMPAAAVDRRTLSGSGGVVGSKLRPGGYRALLGLAHPGERGAVEPADFLGPTADRAGAEALARRGTAGPTPPSGRSPRCSGPPPSGPGHPGPPPRWPRSARRSRRSPTPYPGRPSSALAAGLGTTPRSLQRLFADWVGVSPKWVLQRHRVHLAAEMLGRDPALDLAGLAAAVGYYDQAHFTGDFVRAVGMSPGEYARTCAAALGA